MSSPTLLNRKEPWHILPRAKLCRRRLAVGLPGACDSWGKVDRVEQNNGGLPQYLFDGGATNNTAIEAIRTLLGVLYCSLSSSI